MKIFTLIIGVILSLSSFAQNKISVLVSLSPAGNFEASSEKIRGRLIKENESFKAKKISVSVKSMKTGIDLRDKHLWDYLKSDNIPKIVLTDLSGTAGKATAKLELNGTKRDIQINYTEDKNLVHATFDLKASDFNLPSKSYLGVGVEDMVQIKTTMSFKQK